MGTQIMGSRGGARGGAAGGGSGGTLDPQPHALTQQGSIYNLTLDEVQHQLGDLGKPLSSMNLDELLKSVWTTESGNVGFSPLSRDLSKKTVDEVWRDIQQGKNVDNTNRRVNQREQTLGDITLEDFLVQAGIVSESSVRDENLFPQQSVPPQPQWMPYSQNQPNNMMGVYMPGVNQIVEAVYPEPHMSISPSTLMGALSGTQTPGRKRLASGEMGEEKTVERRQKRMIKNRESAARSRERKQAYTNELENKISRLEEENDRLRRLKEVEKILPSSPPVPKYQLRRTSSASL